MTLISQIENIKSKVSGKITFDENLSKLEVLMELLLNLGNLSHTYLCLIQIQ